MKNVKPFWHIVIIAGLLPIAFAMLDLLGYQMWLKVGGWPGEIYGKLGGDYALFFWLFAYMAIILLGTAYYQLKGDKSETLAIILTPFLLLQFGAEDAWYYILNHTNFSNLTLPWITGTMPIPRIISNIIGSGVITGFGLLISAAIGYITTYFVARWLLKQKW